jgi:uncharacterized DUF497 family protein
MDFRWNDWNKNHIAQHGVDPEEAEEVVEEARPPYPIEEADRKFLVWGPGRGGRLLQVIFVVDEDGTLYVIHARLLTENEKRRHRRARR